MNENTPLLMAFDVAFAVTAFAVKVGLLACVVALGRVLLGV